MSNHQSCKAKYEKTLKDCLEYEKTICDRYKISISPSSTTDINGKTQSCRRRSGLTSKSTSEESSKRTNSINSAQSSSGKFKGINSPRTPSSPKAGKKPTVPVSVQFNGFFEELSEYQEKTEASPNCCYRLCTKKSADAPIAVHKTCNEWMHAECFIDCVVEQRKNNQQLKCPICGEPFFVPS